MYEPKVCVRVLVGVCCLLLSPHQTNLIAQVLGCPDYTIWRIHTIWFRAVYCRHRQWSEVKGVLNYVVSWLACLLAGWLNHRRFIIINALSTYYTRFWLSLEQLLRCTWCLRRCRHCSECECDKMYRQQFGACITIPHLHLHDLCNCIRFASARKYENECNELNLSREPELAGNTFTQSKMLSAINFARAYAVCTMFNSPFALPFAWCRLQR